MKPELATTPRQTPLVLRYEGGVTGLLSDENFEPIKARLFVAEKPPTEILLLVKQPTKAGEARLLQKRAAQKALQTWLGSD